MKGGGDQGQLRTDGRVTPEGPHPGSGSGGGDGGKEGGGNKISHASSSSTGRQRLRAAPRGRAVAPRAPAPADHFLGEGPRRRKLQRLEKFRL